MNIALWIIQALLAVAFGMAGIMKLTQPKEKLVAQMGWVEDFAPTTVKGIGLLEVLAAIGLVLTMPGAIVTHLRRRENQMIVANVVLLALAAFVAYGRFAA